MKRRQNRPMLEGLESRCLLSMILLAPRSRQVQVGVATGGGSGLAEGGGPTGTITDNPNPPATRREAAKQQFRAVFAGNVYSLPPRFADEARQFRITGPGSSSYFLHGTLNLELLTPKDPNAEQVVGVASLQDKNSNDSGVILLNITGDNQAFDPHGRPTHLNFSVNGGGGSGGAFASSVGSGTVDIHYQGLRAVVAFKGKINVTGVGNPLSVLPLNRLPKRVGGH